MKCVHLMKVGTSSQTVIMRASPILLSFPAVERAINASAIGDKSAAYRHYLTAVSGKSNSEAREIAKDIMGESVFWDWDRKLRVLDTSVLI